jgi:ornithine--oxo-acid transaminase
VLDLLEEEGLIAHSARLGEHLLKRLKQLAENTPAIRSVRGKGLFAGIELDPALADAREMAEQLLRRGILTKDTHATVLRLAPPLIIDQATLDWALDEITLEFASHAGSTRMCA